jgi:predicted small secreted protein
LSNKLKVIALLLSVSLLSGCNGTTGSGNSEVSIQSNAPPKNTTSVPTAEAKNPPPATGGNTVRVARWSRDPNGSSMLALLDGTLGIANNCLVITNKDFPPTLLIFPYDSGVWDDAKRSFTYRGKVIGIGEPISVGGGTIPNLDRLKGVKYDVPDCGKIGSLFLVDE